MAQIIYEFELGGAKRTLNFGMMCWEVFCEKMNIGPSDMIAVFSGPLAFKAMRILVYAAISAHAYLSKQPLSISEADVANWLNDNPGNMGEIFSIAAAAIISKDQPKEEAKISEKKSRLASGRSKK